ncbi:HET domain-containing protein [Fusarium sp. LHS14.1]|nr:HET domain-containing protein [Fusarium sp. LHS14.1]
MMLTQDNQDQLRAGNPIEPLPLTFQEAILVSRYIGVRFLWIDCLCIIQCGDDGRGWDAESGRMNVIYQHAYCNISADDASETDGLFFSRDLDFYRRVSVRTREKGGAVVDWTSVDRDMWATEVNNSPLNGRGWVFQERLLAPRVIHFCRQEIFWECRERFCCERFPESLPSAEFLDLSQAVSLRQLPSELWEGCDWHGDENFPVEDLPYEVWDDIIKAYTKSQFTYPSDKLVAISGVAKYTKTIIKDIYLAGMWQKRLSAELAWWMYPDREGYLFGNEPPYYAPSFSWASVKGQINSSGPFAIGILPQVQCVSIESGPHCNTPDQPFANDVFGTPLTSSAFQLRVRGRVRSLKLRKQGDWKAIVHISAGQGISPGTVELDAWLDFHISETDRHVFERETLYLVHWRHGPEAGNYDMNGAALLCMLIRLVDQTRDQFRRIGWAIADDPEMSLMLKDETREEVSHWFDEGKLISVIYLI